jgi:hypothetical protein
MLGTGGGGGGGKNPKTSECDWPEFCWQEPRAGPGSWLQWVQAVVSRPPPLHAVYGIFDDICSAKTKRREQRSSPLGALTSHNHNP